MMIYQRFYIQILKENEYLRLMNGKEVFHGIYNKYSNLDIIPNYDNNNDEGEEEKNIEEENVKGEANINEGEFLIEEMTEKLKQLYDDNNDEIHEEVKEKELILFEEDGLNSFTNIKLDSIDENYIEDLSLEKLNNIKFADENNTVF